MEPKDRTEFGDSNSLDELEQRLAAVTGKIDEIVRTTDEEKKQRGWPHVRFAPDLQFKPTAGAPGAGSDLLRPSDQPADSPDELLRPAHSATEHENGDLLRAAPDEEPGSPG